MIEQEIQEFAALQREPPDPDDRVLAAYGAERVGHGRRLTASDRACQCDDGIGRGQRLLDARQDARCLGSDEHVRARRIAAKYPSFEPEVLLVHRSP